MAKSPKQIPIDLQKPSGPVKAAIFLIAMGDAFTAEVFKNMKEEEVKVVSALMARIPSIPGEAVEQVLNEVREKLALVQGEVSIPIDEFLRTVLFSSMPNEQAERIYRDIMNQLHPSTFQKLSGLDSKVVISFLKNEHPQTVAVILAHLDPPMAADVLRELPEQLQSDVIFRIANLEKISPDVISEIDRVLEEELFSVEMSDAKKVGGAEKVAEILNNSDRAMEESLMGKIEEASEGLAEEIRKLMFKFEDLMSVDDSAISTILKEISTEELKISLKAASEELKAKFFKSMSERAVKLLKEDLEVMPPMRLKDVEKAQQAILKVAKRLESEGKIALGAKGGEDVLV